MSYTVEQHKADEYMLVSGSLDTSRLIGKCTDAGRSREVSVCARRGLEEAARNLMTNHSISVVVASGNSQEDSCMIAPGTCP